MLMCERFKTHKYKVQAFEKVILWSLFRNRVHRNAVFGNQLFAVQCYILSRSAFLNELTLGQTSKLAVTVGQSYIKHASKKELGENRWQRWRARTTLVGRWCGLCWRNFTRDREFRRKMTYEFFYSFLDDSLLSVPDQALSHPSQKASARYWFQCAYSSLEYLHLFGTLFPAS